MSDVYSLKRKELELLQTKIKLKEELPHLYGFPWYSWAYAFFKSRNRFCFLTAGNQLSKSSTQIRKCIDWATDKRKWPELWPESISQPNVMWYLYPTMDVAHEEFTLKWAQFLPRGSMKEDPRYGWRAELKNKKIYAIYFNSGMTVIFKSYAQDVQDLQTGSCYAIFCDEELPMSHFPELQARLNATDGYFSMVFTATLGQDYWRKTIEGTGSEELHPEADKWQISLFDCLTYRDGRPSPWTPDKVERAVKRCASDTEYQRRIMGKFIVEGGLKYASFQAERNMIKRHQIPRDWFIYGGVDPGSGGESGHPAAICFVAVSPDFKQGRVFKGRRMDGIQTTAQDVLDEYVRMKEGLIITNQFYDWASKDFHTFAARKGEAFIKAEKDQELGVSTINTLFKGGMLKIFDEDPELQKLVGELQSLKSSALKRNAKDDFIDAMRYSIMNIPWDYSALDDLEFDMNRIREKPKKQPKTELDLRREFFFAKKEDGDAITDELNEWDELINGFDS